jgi:hypothetical protein
MKQFNPYMLALLSTEGKFSCHKSSCKLENVSHDKLTRFLSKSDLNQEIDLKSLPPNGYSVPFCQDNFFSKNSLCIA